MEFCHPLLHPRWILLKSSSVAAYAIPSIFRLQTEAGYGRTVAPRNLPPETGSMEIPAELALSCASIIKRVLPIFLAATVFGQQSTPHLKNVAAIAKEANGAVVSIVMADKGGHPIAQGSGFVMTSNGRVVTNYHVIKSGRSAVIKFPDGSFFTVDGVLAFNKDRDVAIIKAHGNSFRTLALGDSDRLQIGEEVVAIGSPLSLESTVSNGIVSGIRIDEEQGGKSTGDAFDQIEARLYPPTERKLLQITAPISPGSSGGPLFNMAGQVVGITTSHLKGGENLNFAVPINDAKKLLGLPDSQFLLRFPDEAEAAAAAPEATTPTDNSPSLEETEQWMKDTSSANMYEAWHVDDVGMGGAEIVDYRLTTNPVFAGNGGTLIGVDLLHAYNVADRKPHKWSWLSYTYDLRFQGCSMTVDWYQWTMKSTGVSADYPTSKSKVEFKDTYTMDLSHYNPQVKVHQELVDDDFPDAENTHVVVPKGTKYFHDRGFVYMQPLPKYTGAGHNFFLAYPFAERFGKALSHAITLCGGKAEAF